MNIEQLDFYAPYRMPDGRWLYGAAAANKRMADGGGFNNVAYNLVMAGITLGYENATRQKRLR